MIRDSIARVVDGEDLTFEEARETMSEMMTGSATDAQMAAFITAMRMKGETEHELLGFATEMRSHAHRISSPPGAVDLCGTGGDGKGTLNISTIASLVVSSAGVPVAKHGNRSVSSRCGSADLLGALGIPYELPPAAVEKCISGVGFGFMFAPVFHHSMRNVMTARREVGIRTFFNVLGPMCSPAFVERQLVGVYDPMLVGKVASVLRSLGSKRAMVVNGSGTDEITGAGETTVAELVDGRIEEYRLKPADFGVELSDAGEIIGGSPGKNARAALKILNGAEGAASDAVLMNAAAALYLSGKAESLGDGMEMAAARVRDGSAIAKLREFSTLAVSLETEVQMNAAASELRTRHLTSEVMRARSSELARDLAEQISLRQGGQEALSDLEQNLLHSSSALSVLVLRRLRGVLEASQAAQPSSHPVAKLSERLSQPGVSIIGEYKPRSPTSHPLRVPPDPAYAADVFSESGIAAVSVLQEPEHFGGDPETFAFFRSQLKLPMLYKDFVVTDKQVDSASSLGADAVLLIAKALSAAALGRLAKRSHDAGMETVIEFHDREDVRKIESVDGLGRGDILGVNCRDLRTLEVSLEMLRAVRDSLPAGHLVIAESGVRSGQDVSALGDFDGVLVGSALMQADDMRAKAQELVSAGRRSVS